MLKEFLGGHATHKPLFSPIEAEAERLEELRRKRTTPLSCGNTTGSKGETILQNVAHQKNMQACYKYVLKPLRDAGYIISRGGEQ